MFKYFKQHGSYYDFHKKMTIDQMLRAKLYLFKDKKINTHYELMVNNSITYRILRNITPQTKQ